MSVSVKSAYGVILEQLLILGRSWKEPIRCARQISERLMLMKQIAEGIINVNESDSQNNYRLFRDRH